MLWDYAYNLNVAKKWRETHLVGEQFQLKHVADLGYGVLDEALVEGAAYVVGHGSGDSRLHSTMTWEIRGSRTSVQGPIGLIASRSGTVIGVCDLVDCIGPLTGAELRKNAKKAGMRPSEATLGYYRHTYAWVLKNARRLARPIEYQHPSGAVIWVRLEAAVEKKITAEIIRK